MSALTSSAPTENSNRKKKTFAKWFREVGWRHAVAVVVIIYAIFPILYILSTSLSDDGSIQNGTLFGAFNVGNYVDLFTSTEYPFLNWAWNTIYISSVVAIGSVFMSACAAYAFSRLRFAGRRVGLLSLILIQMFPSILGLVAIFGMLSTITDYIPAIGLGTHAGLILIYLGGSLGAGTYLMYGFFNTVPIEIDEAARMDGASHAQIFFGIILRLVAPILAVMALLSFIGTASDYVLASIVLEKPESLTLAVGLGGLLGNPFSKDWAMFSAGAVLSATPIVVLFIMLQKYIVSGLVGGAVKG